MLLITGRIGMSGLCNFNCVFSVGREAFFWTRDFFFCLSMIKLHCCSVLCMSFLNFLVGSLENKRKLLAARNVCTFLEYSAEFIVIIVLPLST
jgi:hypothetical protein